MDEIESPKCSNLSLFGPGAAVGWLCICCSVVVSWSFNKKHRGRDTILNDFIAALSYPAFSVGFLSYQIITTELVDDFEDGGFWQSEDSCFPSALTICLSFCLIFMLSFQLAGRFFEFRYPKCWQLMGMTCFVALLPINIILILSPAFSSEKIGILFLCAPFKHEFLLFLFDRDAHARIISVTSVCAISSMALTFLYMDSMNRNPRHLTYATPHFWRLFCFIPKSDIPFIDPEQLFALAGGLCTLAFSLRSAWMSHHEVNADDVSFGAEGGGSRP